MSKKNLRKSNDQENNYFKGATNEHFLKFQKLKFDSPQNLPRQKNLQKSQNKEIKLSRK